MKLNYRSEIDGLRAIAVLPVVLYHASVPLFSGGYVGVDVFFVISGFLITFIILSEIEAENFSLLRFYERRARRILPALLAIVAVCYVTGWFLMDPRSYEMMLNSMLGVAGFVANHHFWENSHYFGPAAETLPLLHTWSLAVEEQYYLLFPLLLMFIKRRSILLITLWVLGIGSFIFSVWGVYFAPNDAFFLPHHRVWELLVGSACAFILFSKSGNALTSKNFAGILAWLGLLAILLPISFYNKLTIFPGHAALLPVIGTMLIILFASKENLIGRFLAWQPLVFIGLISYSTYLWHYPLFAFARIYEGQEPALTPMLVLCLISLILGYLSWRFIERPFRKQGNNALGQNLSSGKVVAIAFGSLLGVLAAAGLFLLNLDWHKNYYIGTLKAQELELYNIIQKSKDPKVHNLTKIAQSECITRFNQVNDQIAADILKCAAEHPGQGILLMGDSHGGNLQVGLRYNGAGPFFIAIQAGGCRINDDRSYCFYADVVDFLRENPNAFKAIIYHQSGSYLIQDPVGNVDSDSAFASPTSFRVGKRQINVVRNELEKLAEIVPVLWVGPFLESRINLLALRGRNLGNFKYNSNSVSAFRQFEDYMTDYTKDMNGRLRYFNLLDEIAWGEDDLLIGDCVTAHDRDHLSACGANIVGQIAAKKIFDTVDDLVKSQKK